MKIKVNLIQRAYRFFEKYRDLMTPSEVSAIYSIMSDYCLKGQTPDLALNHDNLPILLMWEILKATIDKALVEDQEIVEEPKAKTQAKSSRFNDVPVPGLTKLEARYLNCLKEARKQNVVYGDGSFRCGVLKLRKATGTDSSTCTSVRESLVQKGIIRYKKGENRNDPVYFWINDQDSKRINSNGLTDAEVAVLNYITLAEDFFPYNKNGYYRAPGAYLERQTGFCTDKIRYIKENLKSKGYIDYYKDNEGFHVYKILK